jgi:hypothetical protein
MNRTGHFGIEPLLEEYLNPARASQYGLDVQKAIFEFIGKSRQMSEEAFSYFTDWFVFEYVMQNGMRVIESFARENPLNLPAEKIEMYRSVAKDNRYDFFEVTHAEKGFLRLVSMRDNETYDVLLQGKIHQAENRDVVICRIGKAGGLWYMLSDSLGLPNPSQKDREQMLAMFPVPSPKLTYEEIVAPEMANDFSLDVENLGEGQALVTGGDPHADDGCPICELTKKAKTEGRQPSMDELMRAFEEANSQGRDKK